jgi:hypothetical protein
MGPPWGSFYTMPVRAFSLALILGNSKNCDRSTDSSVRQPFRASRGCTSSEVRRCSDLWLRPWPSPSLWSP